MFIWNDRGYLKHICIAVILLIINLFSKTWALFIGIPVLFIFFILGM